MPICYSSCQAIYAADASSVDGLYNICWPELNGGLAFEVYCLMSYQQYTAVARVVDIGGAHDAPNIGSSSYTTWAEWTAHQWRHASSGSFYLPLDYFDAMTDSSYATSFLQANRNSGGTLSVGCAFTNPAYDAPSNAFTRGSYSGSACGAGYTVVH